MGDLRLYLILATITITCLSNASEEIDQLLAELEITDLEMQDDWDDLENGRKSAMLDQNFREKITAEEKFGITMKNKADNLKRFQDIPYEVSRNWTLLTKPGDVLLETEDWTSFISYYNANGELLNAAKVPCANGIQGCVFTKAGYRNILEESRDEKLLKETWKSWQSVQNSSRDQFPTILNLIKKAAIANGQEDEKSYWELLLDSEGAYENAQNLWDEIEPFYKKLHSFVQSRIFRFYKITENNSTAIPVYLLGSNFGDDWSHIADIILPHPQLHYDIESTIERKTSKQIYELAENLTSQLSLGPLGNLFWDYSQFNMPSCETHMFSFISNDPHSEVFTCNKTSWVKYLDAFETATSIALRNLDYQSLPRRNLRYSSIDDAIISLGSTFAINNLPFNGILEPGAFSSELPANDSKVMTKLLLTALRVFPKLSYYYAADKFRIEHFQSGDDNLNEKWWKIRAQIQGVAGITNEEDDYLADSNIIGNRPYLSKFFGSILQFHIISSYSMSMMDPNGNVATEIGADTNLLAMLQDRSSTSWPQLMGTYLGVYELTASSLLDYFQPLEEYFEKAPKEQMKIETTLKPSSTSTVKPTTSTSTSTKNTPKPVKDGKSVIQGDQPVVKPVEDVDGTIRSSQTSEIAMYLGIGMLIAVGIIVTFLVVKRARRRLRPERNRRFET